MEDTDCPPPAASHGRLPLDVRHSCHHQISGEAGDDAVISEHASDCADGDGDAVVGGDGDVDADAVGVVAGDGGDFQGEHWWWDSCSLHHRHGNLGMSHF